MIDPIYLSHGSPMLALERDPARDFLSGLADLLPRPRAILVASAHWGTPSPRLNAVEVNETIHDFYGFPPALFAMRYPAPGAPDVAERAAGLLAAAGFTPGIDRGRGLDHGAWSPLILAWPDADIPVLELSLQTHLGPAHHHALGRALAPLADEDVLILGSGSFSHNLSQLRRMPGQAEPGWVTEFSDWMHGALVEHRVDDLLAYRSRAPYAVENHPTDEHLLPLYVALGAGGERPVVERLYTGSTYGVLRMDAYRFGRG